MNQQGIIPYLKFLPLTAFLLYARIYGFTEQAWQGAFIAAGIFATCITIYLLLQSIILDRLMLGVNLFFFVGAAAFSLKIMPILKFYGTYQGAAFFLNIVVIGLITTFISPAGFVGIYHHDKTALKTASYKLLAVSFAYLCISFLLQNYGLFISAALPFIALRLVRDMLVKNLAK